MIVLNKSGRRAVPANLGGTPDQSLGDRFTQALSDGKRGGA
jgi:hypothetical protein